MTHAVDWNDLIARNSSKSNPVDLRIFSYGKNRTIKVYYEPRYDSLYIATDYDERHYDRTSYGEILGDYAPWATRRDSGDIVGSFVPIWGEPDLDANVITLITEDLRKTLNFMDVKDAIPYDDALAVTSELFSEDYVAAACLWAKKFDISAPIEYINQYIQDCTGAQMKLKQHVIDQFANLGVNIKFT